MFFLDFGEILAFLNQLTAHSLVNTQMVWQLPYFLAAVGASD